MKDESSTFKRDKFPILKEKLAQRRSFLLLGPRQTGKSTLLTKLASEAQFKNQLLYYFHLPTQREEFETDPESLIRAVDAKILQAQEPVYLFIDEIQKIPRVLDVLQFLLDQNKIILAATGSSARKMKALGTNWLPGRVHLEHLFPLSWAELELEENQPLFEESLLYGALPGIVKEHNLKLREDDLTSYTALYLEEEIRGEAVLRDLPRFSRFLKLAALESGSLPNYSKLASHVGTTHPTIREYFQILEDTLIIHRLPYFSQIRTQMRAKPKYYFFDLGVRNAAAKIGHHENLLSLQKGVLFEHFVLLELIRSFENKASLYYWRNKKAKIDCVVDIKGKLYAFEIKATTKPTKEDFNGLIEFSNYKKNFQGFVICQSSNSQKFGSFLALPWKQLRETLQDIL